MKASYSDYDILIEKFIKITIQISVFEIMKFLIIVFNDICLNTFTKVSSIPFYTVDCQCEMRK